MTRSLSAVAVLLLSTLAALGNQVEESDLLNSIRCHILADATRFDNGDDDLAYKCIPQRDDGSLMPLQFRVADELVQGHEERVLNGRAYAVYTNSYLQERQDMPDDLVTSPDSKLIFLDDVLERRSLRVKRTGTSTVFIARVVARDSSPIHSRQEISRYVFGGDGESPEVRNLATVFRDCSFGALNMVPATGSGVVGGVGDLVINRKIGDSLDDTLLNVLSTSLEQQYDTGGFDHHVYVIPKGTGGWSAGAFIGGYQSYFNDFHISFVSSQVHELAHNLGMGHSSVAGATGQYKDYEDQSGFMGFSYNEINYPRMCFNGMKNWQFGWYNARSKDLNLRVDGAFVGRLNAFVDFDNTFSGDYVLLKYGENHIQYNSKKGINSETNEAQNQVAVTVGSGAEVSYRVAELSTSRRTYSMNGPDGRAIIEICEYNMNLDFYRVSIYLKDVQRSACNDNDTGTSTTFTNNEDCGLADYAFCTDPTECCSGKCSQRDSPDPYKSVCGKSPSSFGVPGTGDRGRDNNGRGGGNGAARGGGGRSGFLRG